MLTVFNRRKHITENSNEPTIQTLLKYDVICSVSQFPKVQIKIILGFVFQKRNILKQ